MSMQGRHAIIYHIVYSELHIIYISNGQKFFLITYRKLGLILWKVCHFIVIWTTFFAQIIIKTNLWFVLNKIYYLKYHKKNQCIKTLKISST